MYPAQPTPTSSVCIHVIYTYIHTHTHTHTHIYCIQIYIYTDIYIYIYITQPYNPRSLRLRHGRGPPPPRQACRRRPRLGRRPPAAPLLISLAGRHPLIAPAAPWYQLLAPAAPTSLMCPWHGGKSVADVERSIRSVGRPATVGQAALAASAPCWPGRPDPMDQRPRCLRLGRPAISS
jgi:hypothetical protein